MMIIVAVASSPQLLCVKKKQKGGPSSTGSLDRSGKYMPLISYDTIVRINENKNKQQKQAQPP